MRCSASTPGRSPSRARRGRGRPAGGSCGRHLHGGVAGVVGRLAPDPRCVRVLGRRADRRRSGVVDEVLDAEAGLRGCRPVAGGRPLRRPRADPALRRRCGGAGLRRGDTRGARGLLWTRARVGSRGLLAVDSLAWIALTGVKAAGFGLDAVFRWSLARDVIETGFGQVWLGRALLALALAGLAVFGARRRSDRLLGPVVFAGLRDRGDLAPVRARPGRRLTRHPQRCDSRRRSRCLGRRPRLPCSLARRSRRRPLVARHEVVPRFSTLALASVIALVVAGLTSGFLEVRSWQALWHTTYGQLLLVKVALLLPLLALGAFNNRISVPRLRSGAAARKYGAASCEPWHWSSALMTVIVGCHRGSGRRAACESAGGRERSCLSRRPHRALRLHGHRRSGPRRPERDPPLPARLHRPARRGRRDHSCQPRCRRPTSDRSSSRRLRPAPATCSRRRGAAARRRLAAPARRPQGRVRPVERSHSTYQSERTHDAKDILDRGRDGHRPGRHRGGLGPCRHRRPTRHRPARRA